MTFRWDTPLISGALPMLEPLIAAGEPAWIWSRDGGGVLWANPAGGAYLGASTMSALASRTWPATHAVRREIASLMRTAAGQESLARLRLADDVRGAPLTSRCRRLRLGEDRGLLVVGLEGASRGPGWQGVAQFYADAATAIRIIDENGVRLADPEDAGAEDAPVSIPFFHGGQRFYLSPVPRVALAATNEGEAARPHAELASSARPSDPPPLHAFPDATSAASRPGPDAVSSHAEAVEPAMPDALQMDRTQAEEPRRSLAARPGLREIVLSGSPPSGRAASPMDGPLELVAPAEAELADAQESRSIMAGRVARELSRKPVRFLWQTDGSDRFLFVSPGLSQVVGRNSEIVGERWQDAAARLRLDPVERIAHALSQRDTWSGQTAWWPIEGSDVRVPAELTALPIFGGDHSFQGYRGFGVLKPAEALMPAAFEARFGPFDRAERQPAEQLPPYEEATATTPANVVPIRADLERMADQARLTQQERNAFEEIAAALRHRVVEAVPPNAAPAPQPDSGRSGPVQAEPLKPTALRAAPAAAEPEPERPADIFLVNETASTEIAAADAGPANFKVRAEAPPSGAEDGEAAAGQAMPAPAEEEQADSAPQVIGNAASGPVPLAVAPLAESEAHRRLREMTAILDTATDGVIILDADGVIESANASTEALFGLDAHELVGIHLGDLLTPEGRQAAMDYLSGLHDNGVASLLNEGREIEARAGPGTIPLFITMGRISSGAGSRFCAVLRDITHWKRTEADLIAAKRVAEEASGQKSEFLARVSHEIRTPLNAIIGFAEVMIEEQFGPVGNDRYREYLRDIRTSAEHVVSLVNDLLDISKIEAGKLDLKFVAVPLNDLVRESIGLMQPQANRSHVVLRSSLSREVPAIVADQRTMRQIILNLLSNSVKFTGPGGQVIASTTLAESGEAILRIRDTGEGMSEEELARALEPFRQIATATLADRTGTGLGLPLTKALVEANRASLMIRSARGEGTVVTVTFPPTRVLSE